MNVAEMIEWLNGQDQGAIVEVVVVPDNYGFVVRPPVLVKFEPIKHSDYTDLRGNRFTDSNERTLTLGEL